ncbi:GNAT family N-acetyltransferase [Phytohabitans sp. LJ34]|uniref:GNAT family N-acetyltransferase n=1 Tax=Phytohabitans sp. LJ34 TaxID=3452217 RepID=UPI003F8AD5F7
MRDGELTWSPLDGERDQEAVAALAARCHATDGGMTEVTVSRFGADGVITTGARTAAGELVAAAAVRRLSPGAAVIGLVDPAHRGRGIGGVLLDRGLAVATSVDPAVTVETEALTEASERLFASRGLRQVFAEDVMRFDLAAAEPPAVPLPPGLTLREWTPDLAARFFAAYDAAFRDRPGFPGWPAERWVAWTAGDEEFRPQWSLLAAGPDGAGDAGFITCAEGWVIQVGVVPAWRGRGVGGALVTESLRRMREEGAEQVLLDVNVDNPAARLYTRLGFTKLGRRAKFQP